MATTLSLTTQPVTLLFREHPDGGVTPICVFRSPQRAEAALDAVRAYMSVDGGWEAPPNCPEGWSASTMVCDGKTTTRYRKGDDGVWMTNIEARHGAREEWARWDLMREMYDLWRAGNPIDPGAPVGTTYDLIPIPYVESR